jgi:hypothetical protein
MVVDLKKSFGLTADGSNELPNQHEVIQYINLKLAGLGQPIFEQSVENDFLELAHDFIQNFKERGRILSGYLCPADQRIRNFLESYLYDYKDKFNLALPANTFVLDKHGIARVLSLPPDRNEYISDIISSFRIKQGVLHNPKSDRRTTKGVFHIAEGGLPIPDDKKAVPKNVFAGLLSKAFNPPKELMRLPFTASQKAQAELFLSLLLRPVVSPGVQGITREKRMEIRFFAPGNLASNLDFVESIFGNAGDPYLLENDSATDIETWSGHTGCIILAPHLTRLTKKELGLPNIDTANERQKRDGMYWQQNDELYNDGQSFKITARTDSGVILTIIADNYFGYTKKEVKSQISYAANLLGNAEEEHAGGAIAFPSYNLGDEFHDDSQIQNENHTYEQMIQMHSSFMNVMPEGYTTDKNFPDIFYVNESSKFDLQEQKIHWHKDGKQQSLRLSPRHTYILPAGYKIRMEKNPYIPSWRLVGTVAEGTFCHKPSTVSGGGKSEISKSLLDSIIYGPFFTAHFDQDFKLVDKIINKDYGSRYKNKAPKKSRSILSMSRSLGSVIKLLTPSPTKYTDEYNQWLESIPHYIKGLVYIVKRFYKEEWGNNWKKYFSVDIVDDKYGNELKYNERKLVASYLRIGLTKDNSWRTFKLRQDFIASDKIQMEDDITASIVIPVEKEMYLPKEINYPCVKFVENCEYRFFQRPDEAINRGFDKQAEADLATPNTFISNFEPLKIEDAKNIINDAIDFDKYTKPIKSLIKEVATKQDAEYFVSSSHPRIFEGKPSQNMRYLQTRPDLVKKHEKYVAEVGVRLFRKIPSDKPVLFPVISVIAGRRNNPPESGIRSLAVYNPIHYQELPELFMDFICSLTGKSPSTTGAGSEGALTKGPFNSLCAITDLNNALVSFILTGYDVFTTAAGYIGPKYRIDHDISLLIPEIWSRMRVEEREAKSLIKQGLLEKLDDFEYGGQKILASRLGFRINNKFVRTFFGRVFENPFSVFAEDMLKPEIQNMEVFVDGINNIVEAHKRVAQSYFDDGSIETACPPLKALLNIMVNNVYDGKTIQDSGIRELFSRESLLESDWYNQRLLNKQSIDIALWQRHFVYLHAAQENQALVSSVERAILQEKMRYAGEKIKYCRTEDYIKSLRGYIGLDSIYKA